MNDLIKARGLTKSYGGTTVLDSVDITVPAGSIVGFVGANGAGKTCTIRALLGLMPLDSGSVELFGEPLGAGARDEAIVRAKRRIGVVLDTCPFIGDLTVKAVGDVVKAAYPTWRACLFEDLLQRFELRSPTQGKGPFARHGHEALSWRARSPTSLNCSCSTRQPPALTRSHATRCSTSCARS